MWSRKTSITGICNDHGDWKEWLALWLLPALRNVAFVVGVGAAILDHKVILKIRPRAGRTKWKKHGSLTPSGTILALGPNFNFHMRKKCTTVLFKFLLFQVFRHSQTKQSSVPSQSSSVSASDSHTCAHAHPYASAVLELCASLCSLLMGWGCLSPTNFWPLLSLLWTITSNVTSSQKLSYSRLWLLPYTPRATSATLSSSYLLKKVISFLRAGIKTILLDRPRI